MHAIICALVLSFMQRGCHLLVLDAKNSLMLKTRGVHIAADIQCVDPYAAWCMTFPL